MWVQAGGPPDKPVVLYDCDPSRRAKVPTRLLEGFQGYLMTDGYDGCKPIAGTAGVDWLARRAHVRRRFVDAVRAQPKGKRGRADAAVSLIGKLYRIERENKDATPEVRHLARQRLGVPALSELHVWMLKNQPLVTPKCSLGRPWRHMGNLWPQLPRYIERGDLPIDRNRCENTIRPASL